MEEILRQVKEAEEEARSIVAAARREAIDISEQAEADMDAMRKNFENSLKQESEAVKADLKEKVSAMADEARKASLETAIRLRETARKKIDPCVDYVIDVIQKDFGL